MNAPTAIRVIKLGGSLLTRKNLAADVSAWTATLPLHQTNVWLVGGGSLVDQIRSLDQTLELDSLTAHQTSIQLMDVTASIFASLFSNFQLVDSSKSIADLRQVDRLPENVVLQPAAWLSDSHRLSADRALPVGWHVTSDSIAAWVAKELNASELILLKSCPVPDKDPQTLATMGILDSYFPSVDFGTKPIDFSCLRLPESKKT